MKSLISRYRNLDSLYKFIILVILQYIIWFFLYNFILLPDGRFDYYLTSSVAYGTKFCLELLGYDTTLQYHYTKYFINCDGIRSVGIAPPCNGQVLYALFTGFIIATPGTLRKKTVFIISGILIIYMVNVARTAALALIKLHYPAHLNFNHKYTFTIVVYVIIFLLWIYWIRINKKPVHVS